jgi:hypothetical protein
MIQAFGQLLKKNTGEKVPTPSTRIAGGSPHDIAHVSNRNFAGASTGKMIARVISPDKSKNQDRKVFKKALLTSMGLGKSKGNLDWNDGDFAYGGEIFNPNKGNLNLPFKLSPRLSGRNPKGSNRFMYRNYQNAQSMPGLNLPPINGPPLKPQPLIVIHEEDPESHKSKLRRRKNRQKTVSHQPKNLPVSFSENPIRKEYQQQWIRRQFWRAAIPTNAVPFNDVQLT